MNWQFAASCCLGASLGALYIDNNWVAASLFFAATIIAVSIEDDIAQQEGW